MRGKVDRHSPEARPYKRLAEAVLVQAIKDATHRIHNNGKKCNENLQTHALQARRFLLSEPVTFDFWCEVAELQPEATRERLQSDLKRSGLYHRIRRFE